MQIPSFLSVFKQKGRDGSRAIVSLNGKTARIATVKLARDKLQVVKYASRQLSNVESTELVKIFDSLDIGGCQFTNLLAPNEYQLLAVDAPNVPDEELKEAIRWRVKDKLNYPVEDATLDVYRIPAGPYGGDRPQALYVVTATNELIKKRMALFENGNLKMNIIDIPEMAQRNIAELFEDEGRALAVLVVDESGGLLTFTSAGELYMARRIEISLGQLQDADESLRLQSFDRMELEIQRSLDYFDRQFSHITVKRMLLSAPLKSGLFEKLLNNLSVPVERLDLTQVMDLTAVPELSDGDMQADAFYVLGAAMREERRAL